jgi:hypothetical protein
MIIAKSREVALPENDFLLIQPSGNPVLGHESSKALKKVMRGYQPIWRIRSRMSPL